MENTLTGLFLIILAGSCSGCFSLPFKKNTGWEWENNWFIWSIIALLVAPWLTAFLTIPDLFGVYSATPGSVLWIILFGCIWGIGAIMFGKGIHYLGISLSLPIMQGLINSVGTIMPIVIRDPAELLTPMGLKIIGAVSIIIIGIILFSLAGKRKDEKNADQNKTLEGSNFKKGLIICLLAGIFGPMINFAFVFGTPVQEKAVELGASPLYASNAIWSIALTAGFIANIIECIRLFRKNGSWQKFSNKGNGYIAWAMLAGIIWYLSIMFYGMGGNRMGTLGASVGWATMQTLAIVAGCIAGIISGEWKGAGKQAWKLMIGGLIFLIAGVLMIAF